MKNLYRLLKGCILSGMAFFFVLSHPVDFLVRDSVVYVRPLVERECIILAPFTVMDIEAEWVGTGHSGTRGHNYKIFKKNSATNVRSVIFL